LADALNKQPAKDGVNGRITVLRDILSYSLFSDKEYVREVNIKRYCFEMGK